MQAASPLGGQLGLEDRDAASRGGHELESGLQGGAQGAVGLPGVGEHPGQGAQEIFYQLQTGTSDQKAASEASTEPTPSRTGGTSYLSALLQVNQQAVGGGEEDIWKKME